MAKAKSKKKTSKAKKAVSSSAAPKILVAKGGLSPAALLSLTLETMEDDLRISKAAGKDFIESLAAAVEGELNEGRPVNIAHLVKIAPRLHTKGERDVYEVFGDPTSKKVKKKYPAKVTLVAKLGSRLNSKDAKSEIWPTVVKMQKVVGK